MDEGGWVLVRHIPSTMNWHPINDNLAGVIAYGNRTGGGSNPWSIKFEDAVPGYNEFLFATGDCTKWLITSTYQAVGEYYSNAGNSGSNLVVNKFVSWKLYISLILLGMV